MCSKNKKNKETHNNRISSEKFSYNLRNQHPSGQNWLTHKKAQNNSAENNHCEMDIVYESGKMCPSFCMCMSDTMEHIEQHPNLALIFLSYHF